MQFYCVLPTGIYPERKWSELSECQYPGDAGLDPKCSFQIVDTVCPSGFVPLEITPISIRFACILSVSVDRVPIGALKLYNAACNTPADFARQECRDAVMAYGSNYHECVCTNGLDIDNECKIQGSFSVGAWRECDVLCEQRRDVMCTGNCDEPRRPIDMRKCFFGACVQDTPNTNCAGAVSITADMTLLAEERFKPRSTGDTPQPGDYDSTPSWGTACNGSHIAAWYKIQFPFNFNVDFRVRSSSVNAVMSLLQGSCSGITQLACTATPLPTLTSTGLQAGVQYYLRVASTNNVLGSFDLSVAITPAAGSLAGDECTSAIPIDMLPDGTSSINNTLFAATASIGILPANICGRSASSPDVWFSYTPTTDGLIVFSDEDAIAFDPVYSVFEGPCASLKLLECLDDTASFRSLLADVNHKSSMSIYLTSGRPYLIRVSTYNGLRPALGSDNFVLSVRHQRAENYVFWIASDYGTCNADCQQFRVVLCNRTRDNATSRPEDFCRSAVTPPNQRTCANCIIQGDAPNQCTSDSDSVALNISAGVQHTKVGNLTNNWVASVNASDDFRAAICYSSRGYRDFWYRFKVLDNSRFTADVGAIHPTWVLSVYESVSVVDPTSCDSAGLTACGLQSVSNVVLLQDHTYWLRVARPATDTESFFTLTYSFTKVNGNDVCTDALEVTATVLNLTQLSGSINGSFATATPSSGYGINAKDLILNPSCGTSVDSKDLWYQFNFASRGMLQVWIEYATVFKGVISLHPNCNAQSTKCVQYNGDDASPQETDGSGTGRLSYTISDPDDSVPVVRVATFDNTAPAETFVLRWRFTPSAPKPWRVICSQAQQEHVIENYDENNSETTHDTRNGIVTKWASAAPAICGKSAGSRASWVQVTPLRTGRLVIFTKGTSFDTVLSLHKASTDCTGLVSDDSIIACDDDSYLEYSSLVVAYVNETKTGRLVVWKYGYCECS